MSSDSYKKLKSIKGFKYKGFDVHIDKNQKYPLGKKEYFYSVGFYKSFGRYTFRNNNRSLHIGCSFNEKNYKKLIKEVKNLIDSSLKINKGMEQFFNDIISMTENDKAEINIFEKDRIRHINLIQGKDFLLE